jgi:bifunctional DNA primase/polymerase-like protein
MTRDFNRDWALRYAESGFAVFPCRISDDKALDKKPLIKWRDGSTTDARAIAAWWHRWPNSFVGLDLDKCELVVLDADRHNPTADGVAALRALFRQHGGNLSAVPITKTPGKGFHLYFRQGEPALGNREGALPDGINVRGAGGYAIAPHCIRPNDKIYRPVAGQPDLIAAFRAGTIPILPPWIVDIIRPRPEPMAPIIVTHQRGRRFEVYAATALVGMAEELSKMPPESGRNIALNRFAWRAGTMHARGWLQRSEVERALFAAATGCGLVRDTGATSVKKTIASGLKAGIGHPHPGLRDRR